MISKYAPRIPITSFASFLFLEGMLGSLIFIIGSVIMILLAKTDCENSAEVMYGVGFSVIFFSIGLMYFCIQLWKTIRKNNMDGLIKVVKIGTLIFAGVKDLFYLVLSIFLLIIHDNLILSLEEEDQQKSPQQSCPRKVICEANHFSACTFVLVFCYNGDPLRVALNTQRIFI